MQEDEYARLASFEGDYWWFVARRKLLAYYIRQYLPSQPANLSILDIGCGTGATLSQHREQSSHAWGFDYALPALNFTRMRHSGHLGQASILHIPIADNSFDLLTCMDVLYHQWVADDGIALAEMYRVLKPGGILIVTNPAFKYLSGLHDRANFAARRFTLAQLHHSLNDIGFSVLKESYIFALLFPIALIKRSLQRKFFSQKGPGSDIQAIPAWLNKLLLHLFQFELSWLKFSSFPFGTSVLMVAQK